MNDDELVACFPERLKVWALDQDGYRSVFAGYADELDGRTQALYWAEDAPWLIRTAPAAITPSEES